jgi:hypothetical protein
VIEEVELSKVQYIPAEIHWEILLNTDSGIQNETQNCEIGPVWGWVLVGKGEGGWIWPVFFVYLRKIEQWNILQLL